MEGPARRLACTSSVSSIKAISGASNGDYGSRWIAGTPIYPECSSTTRISARPRECPTGIHLRPTIPDFRARATAARLVPAANLPHGTVSHHEAFNARERVDVATVQPVDRASVPW